MSFASELGIWGRGRKWRQSTRAAILAVCSCDSSGTDCPALEFPRDVSAAPGPDDARSGGNRSANANSNIKSDSGHNADRARVQFKMIESFERREAEMNWAVKEADA